MTVVLLALLVVAGRILPLGGTLSRVFQAIAFTGCLQDVAVVR